MVREIDFGGITLSAFVIYNPERALGERNDRYSYVAWLKEQVETGRDTVKYRKDTEKYLSVRRGRGKRVIAEIKEDVLERELERAGWIVLLGNGNLTAQ